jgi:hypothetical protein
MNALWIARPDSPAAAGKSMTPLPIRLGQDRGVKV